MTAAYPRFFQTYTMTTITRLSVSLLNHCGLVRPTLRSSAPSAPTVGSKMYCQASPTPTPESTNGENTVACANPAPRTLRLRPSATSRPSPIDSATVATVNTAVVGKPRPGPGELKKLT